MDTPLDQNIMGPTSGYSPLESYAIDSYYAPPSNPLMGGQINAYGDIVSPYGTMVGTIDPYAGIRDPTWGNEIGWIDSYRTIHDNYGGNLGTIDPYGAIRSPYGS
jgi:hypothetical protein